MSMSDVDKHMVSYDFTMLITQHWAKIRIQIYRVLLSVTENLEFASKTSSVRVRIKVDAVT